MALSTATMINISIHAPRTGSDRYRAGRYNPAERISIHAPRTGSDGITAALTTRSGLFQSTLPARGATAEYLSTIAHRSISIHAPRTGSDAKKTMRALAHLNFNPRSPHGERHRPIRLLVVVDAISIHAPRTGSDKAFITSSMPRNLFQSTLPARGATKGAEQDFSRHCNFNPRSPHGERLGIEVKRPNGT